MVVWNFKWVFEYIVFPRRRIKTQWLARHALTLVGSLSHKKRLVSSGEEHRIHLRQFLSYVGFCLYAQMARYTHRLAIMRQRGIPNREPLISMIQKHILLLKLLARRKVLCRITETINRFNRIKLQSNDVRTCKNMASIYYYYTHGIF